jgi:hypothetical protein
MIAFTETREMQMSVEKFKQELQDLNEKLINFHKYEEKKRGGYVARWVGVSNKVRNVKSLHAKNISGWKKHGWM